jgi:hypothetical protein
VTRNTAECRFCADNRDGFVRTKKITPDKGLH